MKQKGKGVFSITIFGFILATVGIVAPIVWDWWSSSSSITLAYVQETILVEKKGDVAEIEITYDGNKVENLSKVTFRLENSGRLPVVEDDLVEPPILILEEGRILNSIVEGTTPSNLNPTIETINNTVRISFRLLNPNDSIVFSVLTDSIQPSYSASARIKNISNLELVRKEDRVSINKDISWTVYIVGFFSFFFAFTGCIGFRELFKKKAQLQILENKESPIHTGEPISVIKSYIKTDLDFLTGERIKTIQNALPDNVDVLTSEQANLLLSTVEEQIKKEVMIPLIIFMFAIAALGSWYVFNNVVLSGV